MTNFVGGNLFVGCRFCVGGPFRVGVLLWGLFCGGGTFCGGGIFEGGLFVGAWYERTTCTTVNPALPATTTRVNLYCAEYTSTNSINTSHK